MRTCILNPGWAVRNHRAGPASDGLYVGAAPGPHPTSSGGSGSKGSGSAERSPSIDAAALAANSSAAPPAMQVRPSPTLQSAGVSTALSPRRKLGVQGGNSSAASSSSRTSSHTCSTRQLMCMMHIAMSWLPGGVLRRYVIKDRSAVQLKLGLLGCAAGAAAAEELAAPCALAGSRRGRVVRGWAGKFGSNSIVHSGAMMPRRNLAKQACKAHRNPSRPADTASQTRFGWAAGAASKGRGPGAGAGRGRRL